MNTGEPKHESQFRELYRNPRLALIVNRLFDTGFPAAGREDLVSVLGSYFPPVFARPPGVFSGLFRVNRDFTAPPSARPRRLTCCRAPPTRPSEACRRSPPPTRPASPTAGAPNDDVSDIALRVVAGICSVPCRASATA